MNRRDARYATVGTSQKFWQNWHEEEADDDVIEQVAQNGAIRPEGDAILSGEDDALWRRRQPAFTGMDDDIAPLANRDLTDGQKDAIFSGGFADARMYFDSMIAENGRTVTAQDRILYALCRPERLLDIVRRFTVFDAGERKIARHQQFFGVRAAIANIHRRNADNARRGGVIWHTQGSGKSLTMVMLGRALALDRQIANPRIIIVTDRKDLDRQIKTTFKSCDMNPVQAASGSHLLQLIRSKTPLITTVINKFDTAMRTRAKPDKDDNIFILVDESHRTQTGRHGGYGQLAVKMRRLLPQACYLGFTGTPLLRKERNTLSTFGGLIHKYPINAAIADDAVVPLLYEGRIVPQKVGGDAIDVWFDKLSEGLNPSQRADLKQKFSRMDALAKTEQAIRAKSFDISEHFRQHWRGTGFKAQLVAPSKAAAVRFKQILDEIGHVTSDIVISAPNDNEGREEVDKKSKDLVQNFWSDMMQQYKTEEEYNRRIIDNFKGPGDPEILIVVSKLLTGFDAPRNTILYVCKSLRDHNLLQAIARVNRLYEEGETKKQFGLIIDYEGMLGNLNAALTTYDALEGYEAADLAGTVLDIRKHIRLLPQLHNQLLDTFKTIRKKQDMEQHEQLLADEEIRHQFYQRLTKFSRCLHIALSSDKAFHELRQDQIKKMKQDYKRFSELKHSVQLRYQEKINIDDFKPKIEKLLDDHVAALPAKTIIKQVNINDPDALKAIVEEKNISTASKADRIAHAARRTITDRMDEDPSFYRTFSEMLEETIQAYREERISEREYLNKALAIAGKLADRSQDKTIPFPIRGDADGRAFFGIMRDILAQQTDANLSPDDIAEITLEIIEIIENHLIVDFWTNEIEQNKLRNALDDYFYRVIRDKKRIQLSENIMDSLQRELFKLARVRFPR